ncbi:CgeB family protein [Clostridium diolis]|uniref:CgeB family protein n=1 Tax=Clostridium diolis TaxID=223919 RepID=UPI003AF63870
MDDKSLINQQYEALITANEYMDKFEHGLNIALSNAPTQDNSILYNQLIDGLDWLSEVVRLTKDLEFVDLDESLIKDKIIKMQNSLENNNLNSFLKLLKSILPTIQHWNKRLKQICNNINYVEGIYVYKQEKILCIPHITIANDCMDAFKNLGYEVIKWHKEEITGNGDIQNIVDFVNNNKIDYVFSVNFTPVYSYICDQLNVPYISWTVDTPMYSLYAKEITNKNNFSFIYDRIVAEDLKYKTGANNIYYMPVAANIERLDKIKILGRDTKEYKTDISFLGTTGLENELNLIMKHLSPTLIDKINNLFNLQYENPQEFLIKKLLDEDLRKEVFDLLCNLNFNVPKKDLGYIYASENDVVSFILARKFNELERINLVQTLSDKFKFNVYGDDNWTKIRGQFLKFKGNAEHFLEMPKVFKLSKININLTRVYVEAGLPMRVFDVMGSKGFLVTNNKEDIQKYFIDGEDLVIYRDSRDLIEISEYYLHHENERQKILLNGYEKVKKDHTYEIRLQEIMSIVKSNMHKS